MITIHAGEEIPKNKKFTIFLAGPTPRSLDVKSWRPDFIKQLWDNGFNGNILTPENREQDSLYDFEKQINWEVNGLETADLIVFWIPRNLETMPAFTTNIEFGNYLNSGKIVVGFPEGSPNNRYIKKRCEMNEIPLFHNTDRLCSYVCAYEKEESKWYNKIRKFQKQVLKAYALN